MYNQPGTPLLILKLSILLRILGIISIFGALTISVDKLVFLFKAERAMGTVISIDPLNDICKASKRKYNCTRFSALVSFTAVDNRTYSFNTTAGSVRDHNQPISMASAKIGSHIGVYYDPLIPENAIRDSISEYLLTTIIFTFLGLIQIAMSFMLQLFRTAASSST